MTDENLISFDPEFAAPSEWASMYRACGLQVVPAVRPIESPNNWKRPALPQWQQLQYELTPDFTFARWYGEGGEHFNRNNMGLLTGRCSGGVFVVDLDFQTKPEALVWWQSILSEHHLALELETPRQTTGGGGEQLLFRAPEGWTPPTIKTSIGVDIRGQGGFAMLPPSAHQSGRSYKWNEGAEPWAIPILDAPAWLVAEIDRLAEEHGGGVRGAGPIERTASAATVQDAFGFTVDGREEKIRNMVWARLTDLRRESPIRPTDTVLAEELEDLLATYLRTTKTRITGAENVAGLEREGRGPTAFREHWARALRKWDSELSQAALIPKNDTSAPSLVETPRPVDPQTGELLPMVLTAEQFIGGFRPPEYLVDGMIQRGYLYSLTARTGHGKTAVGLHIAQAVARGLPVRGRLVEQGSVLILAGENPDDVRARFLVLADRCGFDPKTIPMHFVAGVIDIEASLPIIRQRAEEIGDLALVLVDTAAAYFKGDDGNSNTQQGAYARMLRQLSFLPGKPAVIVMSHPVKNASKENLLPVGGGAFLNEVDGNLTLWAGAKGQTTLHWQGKFRGPEFEPLPFRLDTATSETVADAKGVLMPSVVATPISELELEAGEKQQESDENILLAVIGANANASIALLAKKANFVTASGEPQKSKVFYICQRLLEDKLIRMVRGKYRITSAGKSELGWNDDDFGG